MSARPTLGLPHLAAAAAAGAALACAGCPGTLDDPGRFALQDAQLPGDSAVGCPDVPQAIFGQICATAGCHTTADKTQGLDLQSPDPASRLVGVCARGGGLLIDPTTPAQSILYLKLSLTPPFGSRMPLGKPSLDDATLACILAWITTEVDAGSGDAGCGTDGGGTD